MSETTVVVHGATGTQGTAIVRSLRAAGHRIRAVARHPRTYADPAVEPVPADLLDLDALAAAYSGSDAVIVQLPLNFGADAVRQADTILAALAKAGVARAVFNAGAVCRRPSPSVCRSSMPGSVSPTACPTRYG